MTGTCDTAEWKNSNVAHAAVTAASPPAFPDILDCLRGGEIPYARRICQTISAWKRSHKTNQNN